MIYKLILSAGMFLLLISCNDYGFNDIYKASSPAPLFSVTYDGNEEITGFAPIDLTFYKTDQKVIVIANTDNLEKTGFLFGGWNTAQNGSGDAYLPGESFPMGSENITLYAFWDSYRYIVEFGSLSADTPADPQYKYVESPSVTVDSLPLPPEKTGYYFGNWFTEPDGLGTEFTDTTVVSSDITLYAMWIPIPVYTVTFNSNEGTIVDSQTIQENGYATAPANPEKSGYLFGRWYSDPELSLLWNFDTDRITADIILYAEWDSYSYTVEFDSQSADISADPQFKHVDSPSVTIDSLPTPPERAAYYFSGWFTEADGGGTEFTASTVVTGNIILYAKWSLIPVYTVTFISDGSTVATQNVAENTLATQPHVVKVGHNLSAWIYGATPWNFNTPVISNIILTAEWTVGNYSINYYLNGGNGLSPGEVQADYDSVIVLEVLNFPENTGPILADGHQGSGITRRFVEWVDQHGTRYAAGQEINMPGENLELTAQWTSGSDAVGNVGPAGGIIIYDYLNSSEKGWRYLEAARVPTGGDAQSVWMSAANIQVSHSVIIADAPGVGKVLTRRIVNHPLITDGAAHECVAEIVTVNSIDYNDWYLPNNSEFQSLVDTLANNSQGSAPYSLQAGGVYWTSTEYSTEMAKSYDKDTGTFIDKSKSESIYFRPVRAFSNESTISYVVTYGENGGSGIPPVDLFHYEEGAIARIMGNNAKDVGGSPQPLGLDTSGSFIGWNLVGDGTSDWYTMDDLYQANDHLHLYAMYNTAGYTLGDLGPAGGKIFYENTNWETDGWRYLEAALTDYSGFNDIGWAGSGILTDALEIAIGTGKNNTRLIVEVHGANGQSGTAAQLCDIYDNGSGYRDWFLPSLNELNEMYTRRGTIGGFTTSGVTAYYWSSTEVNESSAYNRSFLDGTSYTVSKIQKWRVRPIRRF